MKKILAVVLSLVMLLSLCGTAFAGFHSQAELASFGLGGYTPNEVRNDAVSREIALDSYVLLENNGVLPIAKDGKIALFGNGATGTVKGGSGSGIVNQRERDWIDTAFRDAGYEITTPQAYFNQVGRGNVATNFSGDREAVDVNITDAWLSEAKAADTAIYVLARTAGEGSDRRLDSGNGRWTLTAAERNNLVKIAANFENFIVVLNTYVTDITWLREIDNIDAVLYVGYGGQRTGVTAMQVLNGTVTPSGKTISTWAWSLDDYLSSQAGFSWMDNNTTTEYYTDGIYVGYRYFDTFGKVDEVAYPFGYGLSYTDFDIDVANVAIDEEEVVVDVKVTNVGGQYSGKEVIQVYFSAPDSEELEKPYQELAAFGKTDELAPGQAQILTIRFKTADMSSYSEKLAAYVLDPGDYIIRVGNSSRNTHVAAVATLAERVITEQLSNQVVKEENAELEEVSKAGVAPITYEGEAAEIAAAKANATVLSVDALEDLAVDNASPYDDETITTYLFAEDYENYTPRKNIVLKTKNVAGIINNRPEPQAGPSEFLPIQGSGRYVRLNLTPSTNWGVSIYEFILNGINGVGNIARGKTGSASSIEMSNGQPNTSMYPSAALDGNTSSTRWATDFQVNPDNSPWFMVDLGSVMTFESMALYFNSSSASRIEVQVSDDGQSFRTIQTITTVPGSGMYVNGSNSSGGSTQSVSGYCMTQYDEEKALVAPLPDGITKDTAKLTDVLSGAITLEQFVACLSVTEMANLVNATGQGSNGMGYIYDSDGNLIAYTHAMRSNMARSTHLYFETRHIPALAFTDGPAGLRCDAEGSNPMNCPQIRNPGDQGGTHFKSRDGGITAVSWNTTGNGVETFSMYPTCFPGAINVAQTWNTDMMFAMGEGVGLECREYNVNAWLAPGINIHRNPMCGRNFEYFSEDPLLSGYCGGYITAGVQSNDGVAVTLKHYWGNNQENNRNSENNVMSERTAREIYLMGYKIAIELSQPMYMMTSYNENNGWPSADNYDACTDLARGEWGFHGAIMTDWGGGQSTPYVSMHAGNDFICPGQNANNTIVNNLGVRAPSFNANGSIRSAGNFTQFADGPDSYKTPTNVSVEEDLPSAVKTAIANREAKYEKIGDEAYVTWYGYHSAIVLGDLQKAAYNILNMMLYTQDLEILCNDLGIDYPEEYHNFSAAYDALLTEDDYVPMCTKSEIKNVGIVAETVTVNSVADKTVEVKVTYDGDQFLNSALLLIDSALPISDIICDYEVFNFNLEDEVFGVPSVVLYNDAGISGTLFTIVYELDEVLPNGEYPIDLSVYEVTDATGALTSAIAIDGAIIVKNVYPKGDVTQDGEITNADLIMVARYLVHLVEFTDEQKEAADFNDDGQISNIDLILIARAIVGE